MKSHKIIGVLIAMFPPGLWLGFTLYTQGLGGTLMIIGQFLFIVGMMMIMSAGIDLATKD